MCRWFCFVVIVFIIAFFGVVVFVIDVVVVGDDVFRAAFISFVFDPVNHVVCCCFGLMFFFKW